MKKLNKLKKNPQKDKKMVWRGIAWSLRPSQPFGGTREHEFDEDKILRWEDFKLTKVMTQLVKQFCIVFFLDSHEGLLFCICMCNIYLEINGW